MKFKCNAHSDWFKKASFTKVLKMLTMLSFALKMKLVLKIRN